MAQGRIQDFKREGPNKGEGLHYEAMQYIQLNAGWKDKYPGLQDREL